MANSHCQPSYSHRRSTAVSLETYPFYSDFNQVQVIMSAFKPEDRHLVAPFHYRFTPLSCEQANIFWHELISFCGSNVFAAPLQLLHEPPYQIFCLKFVRTEGSLLTLNLLSKLHLMNRRPLLLSTPFQRSRYETFFPLFWESDKIFTRQGQKCFKMAKKKTFGFIFTF